MTTSPRSTAAPARSLSRPVRIVILNQFFFPDTSATSQMMTDLAEDLVRAGFDVSVLTGRSPYVPGPEFAGEETYRGIRIVRVNSGKFDRGNTLRRAASYAAFYISSFFKLMSLRADIVLALTTPPLIAALPCLLKRIRSFKVVYNVQDLYPDIAIRAGLIRSGSIAARLFETISRWTLRSCDAVIPVGSCMRDRILASGAPASRITVIQNWADGAAIRSIPHAENNFRIRQALGGSFVVLYSGNMGKVHEFSTLIGAAERMREERFVFLFIGTGPRRSEIERECTARSLSNVRFLPYAARHDLSLTLSAADLAVVTVEKGYESLMVPSKLYGIMAAGRPVLYVGDCHGEAARTVLAENCGFVVDPGDVAAAVAAIRRLRADPQLASQMGINARSAFQRSYDRSVRTDLYAQLFTDLLGGEARGLVPSSVTRPDHQSARH